MVLDSNILIYASQPAHDFLRPYVANARACISAVTLVEALGYHRLPDEQRALIEEFATTLRVLPVSDAVIRGAVDLRQRQRMSLGDALIAATALAHGLALVTRNAADFGWIDGLALVNPFDA